LAGESFSGKEATQQYDEHAERFMQPVYRRFAAKIAKTKAPGYRVLDIGTGGGRLAIALAKMGGREWRITGIDISQDMLDIARKNVAQAGLNDKIALQQSSGSAMPFADGDFDLVVSNASLHHWIDPPEVFNEIGRVTAPGGFCLIRDNLRLPVAASPLISLIGLTMGMDKSGRQLWHRAIQASYTPGEGRILLNNSALKSAHITINPVFLDLSIEWWKK
jgi:ubiquinone/menaquinone biosynthesis C-methylase UbiE